MLRQVTLTQVICDRCGYSTYIDPDRDYLLFAEMGWVREENRTFCDHKCHRYYTDNNNNRHTV